MACPACPWASELRCNSTPRHDAAPGALAAGPRPPCLETPAEAILAYVRRLARAAEQREDLPLSLEAVFFLLVIALEQCSLGVSGGIGEVGASRPEGGESGIVSFQALSLLRARGEPLFLCGPFLGTDGDGFELRDPRFRRAEALAAPLPPVGALRRLAAAPGNLTDLQLLAHGGPRGFRLLRLGRARGANETRRLLRSAACALGRGGLLLVEGIQGMSDRPGLQEGLHRFLLEDGAGLPGGGRLVPFLWAGKRGGLFLAEEGHAEAYRRSVRRALPAAAQLINAAHDTKFLYGSRVVSVSWEATPRDFEALVRDWPGSAGEPGRGQ